jgi:hypothetical protein
MSSIRKLAAEALEVQDAVNLTAVAKCFATVVSQVRASLIEDGLPCDSLSVRHHPVVRVWADKIYDLCGRDRDITEAFTACQKLKEENQ